MEKVNDRYQEAVEYLLEFPEKIDAAFITYGKFKFGILFRNLNNGLFCLILLKDLDDLDYINEHYNMYPGFGEELLSDNLIPGTVDELIESENKREILERIAYYQRKIDANEYS